MALHLCYNYNVYLYSATVAAAMCYTQHYSTVSTPAGWMKVALKQTNLSLRSLRFQTGHVFPIQGHSPLVSLTLHACMHVITMMIFLPACIQEKEVLYFNILLSESEKPQQSLSHPFDVTFYTLVPEVRIICCMHVCTSHALLLFQAMIKLYHSSAEEITYHNYNEAVGI